jgi:hypothetical protein
MKTNKLNKTRIMMPLQSKKNKRKELREREIRLISKKKLKLLKTRTNTKKRSKISQNLMYPSLKNLKHKYVY